MQLREHIVFDAIKETYYNIVNKKGTYYNFVTLNFFIKFS